LQQAVGPAPSTIVFDLSRRISANDN